MFPFCRVVERSSAHVHGHRAYPSHPFLQVGKEVLETDIQLAKLLVEAVAQRVHGRVTDLIRRQTGMHGNRILDVRQISIHQPVHLLLDVVEPADVDHHRAMSSPLATQNTDCPR